MNAQVLGISVDHVPCLAAWAGSLGGIDYPLLSDFWPHGDVAQKFGVLRQEGYAERAIFIVDAEGIIRYVDVHDIDKQPNNELLFAELRKLNPEAAAKDEELARSPAELPHGGVVMYCTGWCPDCKRAREWLKAHHISFTEVDINKNPGAARQLYQWANGDLVTPTFDINGTIILDFHEDRLCEVLGVA